MVLLMYLLNLAILLALVDISEPALQKALATIAKNIDRQVAKGTVTEADKAATLANIKTFTKLEEGVQKTPI
jgi:3-hydroxybutyryl-CoA dehydrogenase